MRGSRALRASGGVSPAALIVGFVAAALAVCPWVFAPAGAGHAPFLAAVVAWRSLSTAFAWVPAVVLALVALDTSVRRVAVGLLIPAVVLAGFGTASLLLTQHAGRAAVHASGPSQQLTVLSWNIDGSLVDGGVVAREAERHRPDVLVLPDINQDQLDHVTGLLAPAGYVLVHAEGSEAAIFSRVGYLTGSPTDLGPYPDHEAVADSAPSGLPKLYAVHLRIPLRTVGVEAWNREAAWLGEVCRSKRPALVVGDFNASADNFAGTGLAGCTDAATAMGEQYSGTWPTLFPPAVASPLDHVLLAGEGVRAVGFTALRDEDVSGARHRPILVKIEVANGA